ncbi:hypothetical protein CANCADRAFT_32288 [Tortispora caseinolytica NRRL Y-17796]|uniref:Uncharacterized protein n=1 Tax=Tortispora caseinolytica NRRL Y-17796 TaxID=767744 RepID=A0A1E4TAS6_9ASCO|nr:hypothetical protein CANCADRAFT_32288 [Tortispora caseinolytica NRRL Y-17796]
MRQLLDWTYLEDSVVCVWTRLASIDPQPWVHRVFILIASLLLLQVLIIVALYLFLGIKISFFGPLSVHFVRIPIRPGLSVSVRMIRLRLHYPTIAFQGFVKLEIFGLDCSVSRKKLSHADQKAVSHIAENPTAIFDETALLQLIQARVSKTLLICRILQQISLFVTAASLNIDNEIQVYLSTASLFANRRPISHPQHHFSPSAKQAKLDPEQDLPASETTSSNAPDSKLELECALRGFGYSINGFPQTRFLDYIALLCNAVTPDSSLISQCGVFLRIGHLALSMDDVHYALQHLITKSTSNDVNRPDSHTDEEYVDIFEESLKFLDEQPTELVGGFAKLGLIAHRLGNYITEFDVHFQRLVLHKIPPTPFLPSDFDPDTGKCDLPLTFDLAVRELSFYWRLLNRESPVFKSSFPHTDNAHHFIMNALSIAISGTSLGNQREIIYIPSLSLTARTNALFKILRLIQRAPVDPESNICRGSLVITSPTVDLSTTSLPQSTEFYHERLAKYNNWAPKKSPDTVKFLSRYFGKSRLHFLYWAIPRISMKVVLDEPTLRLAVHKESIDLANDGVLFVSFSSIALFAEPHSLIRFRGENGEERNRLQVALRTYITSFKVWFRNVSDVGDINAELPIQLFSLDSALVRANFSSLSSLAWTFYVQCNNLSLSPNFNHFNNVLTKIYLFLENRRSISSRYKQTPAPKETHNVNHPFLSTIPWWATYIKIDVRSLSLSTLRTDIQLPNEIRGCFYSVRALSCEMTTNEINVGSIYGYPPFDENLPGIGDTNLTTFSLVSPKLNKDLESEEMHKTINTIDPALPRDSPLFLSLHRKAHIDIEDFSISPEEGDSGISSAKILEPVNIRASLSMTNSVSDHTAEHILVDMSPIKLNYTPYNLWCSLLAVRNIMDVISLNRKQKAKTPAPPKVDYYATLPGRQRLFDVGIKVGFISLTCPQAELQFVAGKAHICRNVDKSIDIQSDSLSMFIKSECFEGSWSRCFSFAGLRVTVPAPSPKIQDKEITVESDGISLIIPHNSRPYMVLERIVNNFKTIKQLVHMFRSASNMYILTPKEAHGFKMPHIHFISNSFVFLAEDNPFEAKLSNIFLSGLKEQEDRLKREIALKVKLDQHEAERKAKEAQKSRKDLNANLDSTGLRASMSKREFSSSITSFEKLVHHRDRRGNFSKGKHMQTAATKDLYHRPKFFPSFHKKSFGKNHNAEPELTPEETKSRAEYLLKKYDSTSWARKIRAETRRTRAKVRQEVWELLRDISIPEDLKKEESYVEFSDDFPLGILLFSGFELELDAPSYKLEHIRDFLYEVGKGIPKDTAFTLMIPFMLKIYAEEVSIQLRDYPLPFLRVPPCDVEESIPAWSFTGDFVIGEELAGPETRRYVPVTILTPDTDSSEGWTLYVPRTLNPVKTYCKIDLDISSNSPTRICWSEAIQPALGRFMARVDALSKPKIDHSPVIGFWDKLRLQFHSRIAVRWKGSGDVILNIKGTRSPYNVGDHGSGFSFCWRDNVEFHVNKNSKPQEFMEVVSQEFYLAIPDLSRLVDKSRPYVKGQGQHAFFDSFSYPSLYGEEVEKLCMKVAGNVQWLCGVMFQHTGEDGKLSYKTSPHYNVTLIHPHYSDKMKSEGKVYDAFESFRTHHIHLAISVTCPENFAWKARNMLHMSESRSVNSVHLSPQFFYQFLAWWSMFSGVMSIPISQGKLFSAHAQPGAKFSRHLTTMKYRLCLAPLYICHVYLQEDTTAPEKHRINATGLKLKLDSFVMDLHQRREPIVRINRELDRRNLVMHMKLYSGQIDMVNADMRVVSGKLKAVYKEPVDSGSDRQDSESERDSISANFTAGDTPRTSSMSSRFINAFENVHINDDDFAWVDFDDFVDHVLIPGLESTTIDTLSYHPFLCAPYFTYFRDTSTEVAEGENNEDNALDGSKYYNFGSEHVHECLIGNDDPIYLQRNLAIRRSEELKSLIDRSKATLTEIGDEDPERAGLLNSDLEALEKAFTFCHEFVRYSDRFLAGDKHDSLEGLNLESSYENLKGASNELDPYIMQSIRTWSTSSTATGLYSMHKYYDSDDRKMFHNRFMLHNVLIKWDNDVRNSLLSYIHSVSKRRGDVYYLSQKAAAYIENLVKQTAKFDEKSFNSEAIEKLLSKLLEAEQERENSYVPRMGEGATTHSQKELFERKLRECRTDKTTPVDTYLFRMISPQIQMSSNECPDGVILMMIQNGEARVTQIYDKAAEQDEVCGLVETRYGVILEKSQMFCFKKDSKNMPSFAILRSHPYGTKQGSTWPPWLPIESVYDEDYLPVARVANPFTPFIRYDRRNPLRIGKDDISIRDEDGYSVSAVDEMPDVIAGYFNDATFTCDSEQYATCFVTLTDLFMYSEPINANDHDRVAKLVLQSDFTNVKGVSDLVKKLQSNIRDLGQYEMILRSRPSLDRHLRHTLRHIHSEANGLREELHYLMQAIDLQQSQIAKTQKRGKEAMVSRKVVASGESLIFHMLDKDRKPFVDFAMANAIFRRSESLDGSNSNQITIDVMQGFNLVPNSLYPELFLPYINPRRTEGIPEFEHMISVSWVMLEPIGGIPVMLKFEGQFQPLKIQLEDSTGKALMEYIFPNAAGERLRKSRNKHKELVPNDGNGSDYSSDISGSIWSSSDTDDDSEGSDDFDQEDLLSQNAGSIGTQKNSKRSGLRKLLSDRRSASHKSNEDLAPGQSSGRISDHRSVNSSTLSLSRRRKKQDVMEEGRDDVEKMQKRAANYISFLDIVIDPLLLCVSFRGPGKKRLATVHEFELYLPTIEFQNKTWSNLDLVNHLKKLVIKSLLSHTGAILENKITRRAHRGRSMTYGLIKQVSNYRNFLSLEDITENSHSAVPKRSIDTQVSRVKIEISGPSENSGEPERRRKSSSPSVEYVPKSVTSPDLRNGDSSFASPHTPLSSTPVKAESSRSASTTNGNDLSASTDTGSLNSSRKKRLFGRFGRKKNKDNK